MFRNLKEKLDKWKEVKQIRKELYALSDRDLEDIGVNRYEIQYIVK